MTGPGSAESKCVPSTLWAHSMALGCVSFCPLPHSAFNLQLHQANLFLAALSLATPHPRLEAGGLCSSVYYSVVPLVLKRSDHVGQGRGGGAEEGDR